MKMLNQTIPKITPKTKIVAGILLVFLCCQIVIRKPIIPAVPPNMNTQRHGMTFPPFLRLLGLYFSYHPNKLLEYNGNDTTKKLFLSNYGI
jgi:hypothetical protein